MKKLLMLIAVFMTLSLSVHAAPQTIPAKHSAVVTVNGLVCDFCARAVEKVFGQQEAVESVKVNLDEKIVTLIFKDNKTLDDKTITTMIMDSGYNVVSITHEGGGQ